MILSITAAVPASIHSLTHTFERRIIIAGMTSKSRPPVAQART